MHANAYWCDWCDCCCCCWCACNCEWIASALQLNYWWASGGLGWQRRWNGVKTKQRGNNTWTKDDDVVPHCFCATSSATLSCHDCFGSVCVGGRTNGHLSGWKAILTAQLSRSSYSISFSLLDWDWVSNSLNIDQVAIVRWRSSLPPPVRATLFFFWARARQSLGCCCCCRRLLNSEMPIEMQSRSRSIIIATVCSRRSMIECRWCLTVWRERVGAPQCHNLQPDWLFKLIGEVCLCTKVYKWIMHTTITVWIICKTRYKNAVNAWP